MIDVKEAVEIGRIIKQARKAKNITQTELGELLNLKKAAISKYEKGLILNMPLENRFKIASILNLPGYLLCSDDELKLFKNILRSEQQQ